METYNGIVDDYNSFIAFLNALAMIISEMFGDKCEVVVSDLDNPKRAVLAIYNGHVTEREIGDPLSTRAEELIERSKGGYSINYKKANKRIKKEIKSSTIVTKAFGKNLSFCINYDCQDMQAINMALNKFLSMGEATYKEFDVHLKEKSLEEKFEIELGKMNKSIVQMNKNDRKLLIARLKDVGVFEIQKSIPYVADRLGVSRYTIYNYLKEI